MGGPTLSCLLCLAPWLWCAYCIFIRRTIETEGTSEGLTHHLAKEEVKPQAGEQPVQGPSPGETPAPSAAYLSLSILLVPQL